MKTQKVFGSTRRSRNTTTENLDGSWTRMVTASSCGSLCRKGNCGDYVPGERLFLSLADNSMRFCITVPSWQNPLYWFRDVFRSIPSRTESQLFSYLN